MADSHTIIFADGMTEATVTHGVARITLAQSGPEGKPVPVGQLCLPLLQLPGFANGLLNLMKQVEQRAKAAGGAGQQPAQGAAGRPADGEGGSGETATTSGSVPGAFRFQS